MNSSDTSKRKKYTMLVTFVSCLSTHSFFCRVIIKVKALFPVFPLQTAFHDNHIGVNVLPLYPYFPSHRPLGAYLKFIKSNVLLVAEKETELWGISEIGYQKEHIIGFRLGLGVVGVVQRRETQLWIGREGNSTIGYFNKSSLNNAMIWYLINFTGQARAKLRLSSRMLAVIHVSEKGGCLIFLWSAQ